MVKNNHAGGEDDVDSGLYSPDDSAAGAGGGGSNGVVAKLKRLLDARQESTLSAMMEELDEEGDDLDHDYNYNHSNGSEHNTSKTECRQQQEEEKKEEHSKEGNCNEDGRQSYDKNTVELSRNEDSDAKDKQLQQRQHHIQRLQTELQSRHISSLQSLNYLSPYELSIARNNLVDPADIAVSFGDVGGMDNIKSEIYDLVVLPLLRPDLFDCESGLVSPPKGILLYG
jgi:ATP-dependent 26S proteasome regulatory subunit